MRCTHIPFLLLLLDRRQRWMFPSFTDQFIKNARLGLVSFSSAGVVMISREPGQMCSSLLRNKQTFFLLFFCRTNIWNCQFAGRRLRRGVFTVENYCGSKSQQRAKTNSGVGFSGTAWAQTHKTPSVPQKAASQTKKAPFYWRYLRNPRFSFLWEKLDPSRINIDI